MNIGLSVPFSRLHYITEHLQGQTWLSDKALQRGKEERVDKRSTRPSMESSCGGGAELFSLNGVRLYTVTSIG